VSATSTKRGAYLDGGRGRGPFASNRNRLLALLIVSTVAIGGLAFKAASGDLSYYVEPEEFLAQIEGREGNRWRVGGRVVEGSVVEAGGRPVAFEIVGESGETISVVYESGVVPNLFTDGAFVVVEGGLADDGHFDASSLVIKHENEFFSDTPPPDSPSANLLQEE
jgi:cytochrome c-type biogenesis protein CcmE